MYYVYSYFVYRQHQINASPCFLPSVSLALPRALTMCNSSAEASPNAAMASETHDLHGKSKTTPSPSLRFFCQDCYRYGFLLHYQDTTAASFSAFLLCEG